MRRITRVISVGGIRKGQPPEASSTAQLLRDRYDYHKEAMGFELPPLDLTLIDLGVNTWQNLLHALTRIEQETREFRKQQGSKIRIVVLVNWSQAQKASLWLRPLVRKVFGPNRRQVKTETVGILSYDHKAWIESAISTLEGIVGLVSRSYRTMMEQADENYSSPIGKAFDWTMLRLFGKHV